MLKDIDRKTKPIVKKTSKNTKPVTAKNRGFKGENRNIPKKCVLGDFGRKQSVGNHSLRC